MKQLSLIFLILASVPAFAQAQTEISVIYAVNKVKPERFGDFESFAGIPASQIPGNFQATPSELEQGFKEAFGTTKYLRGISASGAFYLNKHLAIVGDFGVATHRSERHIANNPIFFEDVSEARRTQYTILGGVQWKYRKHGVEPFVRGLAGVVHSRNRILLSITNPGNSTTQESFRLENNFTAFALGLGGGIDVKVNNHLAVRVIQVDYIPVFSKGDQASLTAPGGTGRVELGLTRLDNTARNTYRIGFGVVFR